MTQMISDWNTAYGNADHVADSANYPPRWQVSAASFRQGMAAAGIREDIEYGPAGRNRLDLFLPRSPRGLVVFVHGGYWMRFDKSLWSHFAAGPLAHGFAVAMPSYTLCPDAGINAITQEIGRAISHAATLIKGEIRLAGHSAGGHLVTRMLCSNSPLPKEVMERVTRTISISGVHDLRPLLRTAMNEILKLDKQEAWAESPALLEPVSGCDLVCWAGAEELPEFVRQNALLANIWTGCGASTRVVEEAEKHHFNVVEGLADPNHPLTQTLCI